MKLSVRLQSIADMIPEFSKVYDVGCDHGLLDIFLVQHKNCQCIAIDNKVSALNQAKKNIEKYHLNEQIALELSEGLTTIEVDDGIVVCAGMGSHTIVQILKPKIEQLNTIVVQSNHDLYLLRSWLYEHQFQLVEERVCQENSHFYVTMKWQRGMIIYSPEELYFGPILLQSKDSLINDYLEFCYQKLVSLRKYKKGNKFHQTLILYYEKRVIDSL